MDSEPLLGFEQEWTLDQLGNWDAFKQNDDGTGSGGYELEQTRTENDANEVTGIAATVGTNWVDPAYDAAGNTTKRPDPADPGTDTSAHLVTYDAWGRVVKITDNAGTPVTIAAYEYDGLGRRIEKTIGSDTYDYYHNESWQVVEVRKNDDANPLEQFVYDTNYVDALLIRWYDGDTDGDLGDAGDGEQYYVYDASFNVIALLDEQGTTLERYRYTPYGTRVVLDADFSVDADNTTDYGNQRGFQGLLHDEESGLIENRNRMLDPLTGRFLQRDPHPSIYPDGMNAYAAYHVMWGGVDPWGLKICYPDWLQERIEDFEWDVTKAETAIDDHRDENLDRLKDEYREVMKKFEDGFEPLSKEEEDFIRDWYNTKMRKVRESGKKQVEKLIESTAKQVSALRSELNRFFSTEAWAGQNWPWGGVPFGSNTNQEYLNNFNRQERRIMDRAISTYENIRSQTLDALLELERKRDKELAAGRKPLYSKETYEQLYNTAIKKVWRRHREAFEQYHQQRRNLIDLMRKHGRDCPDDDDPLPPPRTNSGGDINE